MAPAERGRLRWLEIDGIMPMTPRFIYFDLGNVLLYFDQTIACRQISQVAGISEQRVRDVLYEEQLQRRYETGAISTREFYEVFCEQTGTRPDFDALNYAGSAMFELNTHIVPLVAHLCSARCRIGILSNTCEAHWNYVSNGRFRIIPTLFEHCVLSFRTGVMKPGRDIYLAAADLARVRPKEILFLDDREENVVGARETGLDAIQYSSPQALAVELRKRGVEFNY